MSDQIIPSELLTELSTEEQEVLVGGYGHGRGSRHGHHRYGHHHRHCW
jgi:hypothetical protein